MFLCLNIFTSGLFLATVCAFSPSQALAGQITGSRVTNEIRQHATTGEATQLASATASEAGSSAATDDADGDPASGSGTSAALGSSLMIMEPADSSKSILTETAATVKTSAAQIQNTFEKGKSIGNTQATPVKQDEAILSPGDPRNAEAYMRSGVAKLEARDYKNAIIDFDRTVQCNDRISSAFLLRGLAKSALGNADGAVDDYTAALKIEKSSLAYALRGKSLMKIGNAVDAFSDEDNAIQMKQGHEAIAWQIKGLCRLRLKDARRAIADFDQAIKANPQMLDACAGRGQSYLYMDQYDKAIADFTYVITKTPAEAVAYMYRSLAYLGKHDLVNALSDAQKLVALVPKDPISHRILAYALEDKGDLAGAQKEYEAAATMYGMRTDAQSMKVSAARVRDLSASAR